MHRNYKPEVNQWNRKQTDRNFEFLLLLSMNNKIKNKK